MRPRPRRSSAAWVLGLAVSACVGLPPSPPQDSASSATTGTSNGDATTASPTTTEPPASVDADTAGMTAGTTLDVTPGTSTGDVPGTSSSGTSTGEEAGSSSSDATGSSTGEPPPLTCQEIFGTASGYTLCMEDETSCTFALNGNGNTCNTICNSFGRPCLGAIDNPGGLECTNQGSLSCDQVEGATTICICSK